MDPRERNDVAPAHVIIIRTLPVACLPANMPSMLLKPSPFSSHLFLSPVVCTRGELNLLTQCYYAYADTSWNHDRRRRRSGVTN